METNQVTKEDFLIFEKVYNAIESKIMKNFNDICENKTNCINIWNARLKNFWIEDSIVYVEIEETHTNRYFADNFLVVFPFEYFMED